MDSLLSGPGGRLCELAALAGGLALSPVCPLGSVVPALGAPTGRAPVPPRPPAGTGVAVAVFLLVHTALLPAAEVDALVRALRRIVETAEN
ncbi:hypothetical protein LN042_02435 [Kitasatospora sp. RB6PN24]|uniref:hypothetical protein n=1 Tax=Kitasatospora humi TaxID=2893891 RepID=UPI001E504349|nr:hypothetical protein [Kitasatospora humi]MCC9305975.1 hypothetical protein [Kitasatospora humi]